MRATLNMLCLAAAAFAAYALLRGWIPDPLAGLPVSVRGILALVVLALGVCGYAAGPVKHSGDAACVRRKPGSVDYATAIGALLALHFGFLWLLGAAPPVIERIGIAAEPWLRPEAAAKRVELASANADAVGEGNWLWQDRRSRALPQRTNLRPGNRPEVFLRFPTPEDAAEIVDTSAYLASFSLTKFAGDRWTTPDTEAADIGAEDDGFIRFPTPHDRAARRPVSHEVFHGANRTGQNVLITLQGVDAVEIPQLDQYDDGFLMLPSAPEEVPGFQYRAISRPLAIADLSAEIVIAADPDTPDFLLDLPLNKRVADHLRDQARAIAGENPTVDSIATLESWMREAFDYSLETNNPLNLDPLENFLFSERRGHCEHFAMTAALMLRSLGIPSRVAYGWAGGTWYESSQLMVFRAREAHAWTEFRVPGYGWVVMDPTPPSAIDGTRARVAPPEEEPPDPSDALAIDPEIADATRIDLAAAWMLAICGLPALLMLILRSRFRRRAVTHNGAIIAGQVTGGGYLGAWCACCRPRHPGETLRQQIHRHQPSPPFASRLIDYHYRTQYTPADRDPITERELERAIRTWSKQRQPADFRE
ncbi:MAG: transglutaminase-like domain-containing protein [Luteolibacter sp.]